MTEIERLVEVYGKDAAAEERIVLELAKAWQAVRSFEWADTDNWRRKIRKAQRSTRPDCVTRA